MARALCSRCSSPRGTSLGVLGLIGSFVLLLPREAHAYLDAGSGSLLIQALVGGAAAALVIAKTYWAKIKGFFAGESRDTSGDTEGHADG